MASVKPVEDGDTESRPPSDASAAVPTEKEKEMLEAFRMIDQDNSGHITARELGIVLRVGGSKIKDKDVKQAIMMLDPGGDGSIGANGQSSASEALWHRHRQRKVHGRSRLVRVARSVRSSLLRAIVPKAQSTEAGPCQSGDR